MRLQEIVCTRTFWVEFTNKCHWLGSLGAITIWLTDYGGGDAVTMFSSWFCPLKNLSYGWVSGWVAGPFVCYYCGGGWSSKLARNSKRTIGRSFWRKHLWWQIQVPLRLTILVCTWGQACGGLVWIWMGFLPSKYGVLSPRSNSGIVNGFVLSEEPISSRIWNMLILLEG